MAVVATGAEGGIVGASPSEAARLKAQGAEEWRAGRRSANAERRRAHYGAAAESFAAAAELAPHDHTLFSNLAAALTARAGKGDAERALAAADECVALNPGFSKGHGRRGDALWLARDYVGARAAYEDGLRAEPGQSALQDGLAKCVRKINEIKRREANTPAYVARHVERTAQANEEMDAAQRELVTFWRAHGGAFAARWLRAPRPQQEGRLRALWPQIDVLDVHGANDAHPVGSHPPSARADPDSRPDGAAAAPLLRTLCSDLSVTALCEGGGQPLVELFQRRVAELPRRAFEADLALAARCGVKPVAPLYPDGTAVALAGPNRGKPFGQEVLNAVSGDRGEGSAAPVGMVPSHLFELAEQRRLAIEGLLAAVAEEHCAWQRQRDAERAANAAVKGVRAGTIETTLALGPGKVAEAIVEASSGEDLVIDASEGHVASAFEQAKAAAARRRAERKERMQARRDARRGTTAAGASVATRQGGSAPTRYVLPTESVPHDSREGAALAQHAQDVAEAEGAFQSMAAKMEALLSKESL